MEIIKIKNLSFSYNSNIQILSNITLEIKEKEFVTIIGENGSGKTTLLKCISGLNKVDKDKIEINEKIGYLPQTIQIQDKFPATIEEIVLSGTIGNTKNIWYTKEDKKKTYEILKELNLYEIRKKCFSDLSGGQKQRVLIARALCSTDKLLLLDEPINGLDPKILIQMYELLKDLNTRKKITIIMVTHDVERSIKYSDRIIELKNGKINYDGPASKYKEGGKQND